MKSRGSARSNGQGSSLGQHRRTAPPRPAPPRPRPGSALGLHRPFPALTSDPPRLPTRQGAKVAARAAVRRGGEGAAAVAERAGTPPTATPPPTAPPLGLPPARPRPLLLCAVGAVARATAPPRPGPALHGPLARSPRGCPPSRRPQEPTLQPAAGRDSRSHRREQSSSLRVFAFARPDLLLAASVRWWGPADQLALRLRTEAPRPPQGPAYQTQPGAARLPVWILPLMTPGKRLPWRGMVQTRW